MKKLMVVMAVLAAATAVRADDATLLAIRPEVVKGAKTSAVWESQNRARLATVNDAWCATFLKGGAKAADALLAEVKPAYYSDPFKLVQIAALTQYCMKPGRTNDLSVWKSAVLRAAQATKDSTVAVFMLDQLRWCGSTAEIAAIRALGAKGDRAVREMAQIVVNELSGNVIGK